ncbi:hypothetical protein D9M72_541710 [compost metagenome]
MRLVEPAHRAVVEDEPVLAQHQAIARLADRQLQDRVAVEPVEELRGVGAENLDLAERRDVAEADIGSHVQHFAIDAFAPGLLAGAREPRRAMPEPRLDEGRTVFHRPAMQR